MEGDSEDIIVDTGMKISDTETEDIVSSRCEDCSGWVSEELCNPAYSAGAKPEGS
jgi:hypothetical protein